MGREMQVMKTIGNIFLFLKTCIMVSDLKKKSLSIEKQSNQCGKTQEFWF